MHETRNLIVIILLVIAVVWGFWVWFVSAPFSGPATAGLWVQRWTTIIAALCLAVWCWYALTVEDKLPDRLARSVGTNVYYDVDGLSFIPTVRVTENGQAELSLYYQNRFENYAQAIVHLRPPEESFVVRPGMRDMHFAFKAEGGDFGVLHQPIGIPRQLQGEVLEVKVAAVCYYPRSHGGRLIKREGLPCGSFPVDWGQAFKVGVHEVSGEIELRNPASLHLSMPTCVNEAVEGSAVWKQELIEAGPTETAVLT